MTELSFGQVWVCKASETVPPLMCIVGKLDQFGEKSNRQQVVSVLVTPHPDTKKAGWPIVSHMPVSEDAFLRSGLSLAKEGVLLGEDFDDGYAIWLTAFQEGKAGIFSTNVCEAYAGITKVTDNR